MNSLRSIHIRGFRTLADVEISALGNVCVMIGANGSGKSNFMRFFEMLGWMLRSRSLEEFILRHGGADDQLYGGFQTTKAIEAEISMDSDKGRNDYRFILSRVHPDRFIFAEEAFRLSRSDWPSEAPWTHLEMNGDGEAQIVKAAQSLSHSGINPTTARVIVHLLRNCAVHQFHNTSDNSNLKIRWDAGDSNYLRTDGGNLAAVLHRLENEDYERFERICRYISRILPAFDRFQIEESYGKVQLGWKAKGTDKTIGAHLTSDGSLRFFALVTLLNLPREMLPNVLLLDEPELGLHPTAINLIGEMIKSLSLDIQIFVATQSPLLVDVFDLEEIMVFEAEDGRTTLCPLKVDDYRNWLNESYTPGGLWLKNLLGGRP